MSRPFNRDVMENAGDPHGLRHRPSQPHKGSLTDIG